MGRIANLLSAICMAVLPVWTAASRAAPLTLEKLYAMPIQRAAESALGPGPEKFVERSPWNSIEQNYVLDTVGMFGMSFYTRAEKLSPFVCRVTLGQAAFDTRTGGNGSSKERGSKELAYEQKPLRLHDARRTTQYFVAGSALPVPLKPGEKPAPLNPASRADGNCENPVSARKIFDAPSPEAATAAIALLNGLIVEAGSGTGMSFALSCREDRKVCPNARAKLAAFDLQAVRGFRENACAEGEGVNRCVVLDLGDSYASPSKDWWAIEVRKGPDGHIVEVKISREFGILI